MKTLNLIHIHSKILFWAGVGLVVSLALLYMVFVNITVRSVVTRQILSEQVVELRSTLGALESEYIASSHIVSMELATTLGFKEVYNPIFISKKQAVSLNSSR